MILGYVIHYRIPADGWSMYRFMDLVEYGYTLDEGLTRYWHEVRAVTV